MRRRRDMVGTPKIYDGRACGPPKDGGRGEEADLIAGAPCQNNDTGRGRSAPLDAPARWVRPAHKSIGRNGTSLGRPAAKRQTALRRARPTPGSAIRELEVVSNPDGVTTSMASVASPPGA